MVCRYLRGPTRLSVRCLSFGFSTVDGGLSTSSIWQITTFVEQFRPPNAAERAGHLFISGPLPIGEEADCSGGCILIVRPVAFTLPYTPLRPCLRRLQRKLLLPEAKLLRNEQYWLATESTRVCHSAGRTSY